MAFSESGPSTAPSPDVNREGQERETTLQASKAEQVNLSQEIENGTWQGIPENAKAYLEDEAKCPAEYKDLAIKEAQALLAKDPTALDDPDLSPFALEECVDKANERKFGWSLACELRVNSFTDLLQDL